MLQLERINVVEETLNQIYEEMNNGQFDEDLKEMFRKISVCGSTASLIGYGLLHKIEESEEETDEDC